MHPTALVDPKDPINLTKFLGPEALRGSGVIMLNARGERFVNELDRRDLVSAEIAKHGQLYRPTLTSQQQQQGGLSAPQSVAYLLLNGAAAHEFGQSMLDFYCKKGLIQKFASLNEVAQHIGPLCHLEDLQRTLSDYTAAAAAGHDKFGKTVFPVKKFDEVGPFWVAIVTPAVNLKEEASCISCDRGNIHIRISCV